MNAITPVTDQSLVRYETACRAIAEAKSVDEVLHIRGESEMLRAYARQANNKTLEADAAEIRLRAERRLGELIRAQKETVGLNTDSRLVGPSTTRQDDRPTLAEAGIDKHLADRARKAAAMSEPDFEAKVERDRDRVIGGPGSPLTLQSKSMEWYTPAQYIEAARVVLGGIDLDPASCEIANQTVRADRFYSAEDDGLRQQWSGRVWLNPPYCGLAGEFIAKLAEEYQAGNVTAAVVLVNAHATDTKWFQPLWAGHLCFTDRRINFYGPGTVSGNTHGSTIVYFGKEPDRFVEVFDEFGPVVARLGRLRRAA
jgi:phage N-6-adenine-methyltransferase